MKKKLLIIDGNSLLHRAYHALPPLKTKKGELVNGVYGFCLVFLKVIREIEPNFIIATFDLPHPTFRHKEFKEYKAKRTKAPKELYQQIIKIKQILRAFEVPIFEKKGFEADDLIGTITRLSVKKQIFPKLEIIILSGDLDLLQLIDSQTKMYTMKKGIKETIFYNLEKVKEKYQGLSPCQLPDLKGLKGDFSDNIPGVKGIGEKTALFLIKEFGSLENLYQEIEKNTKRVQKIKKNILTKLKENKEEAFFSKKMATLNTNAPIDFKLEDCYFGKFNRKKIIELFKELEFYTLVKRISELFFSTSFSKKEKEQDLGEQIEKLYQQGVFSKKIYQIEKALIPIVKQMERNGIKIDFSVLEKVTEKLNSKIKIIQKKIYQIAGVKFNLNSAQQVSQVLFEKLKISPHGLRKTKGGIVSTEAEELKKIRQVHSIIGWILKYREFFKLKSGFCDRLKEMIDLKDGRIHPKFNQLGSETGRISCSKPNLQNIPTKSKIGREIRKCFVPEKGFLFLSGDWSQMELRIIASLSEDQRMIELFEKGEDIHKLIVFGLFHSPNKKITFEMRNFAKTLNYGVLYGMNLQGFVQRTDISFEKAKKFFDDYFKKFKGITKFIKNSIVEAKKKGFAETIFGRKRFFPEINSIDKRLKKQAERMAINLRIQGTAADICKIAMVEIAKKKILTPECKMILQIHDELLFEVKKEKIKEIASKIKEIMENVIKFKVPLKVNLKIGKNWADLKEFNN